MSEEQANYKTVAEDDFKTRLIKEEKQVRERVERLSLMATYQQVLVARLELILSVEELKELLEQM